MNLFKHVIMALPLMALTLGAAQQSQAQSYWVTDLGKLTGSASSTAQAVNDSGWVVGPSSFSIKGGGSYNRPFVWIPSSPNAAIGTMYPMAVPSNVRYGDSTLNVDVEDISDAGISVGTVRSTQVSAAVIWQNKDTVQYLNSIPGSDGLTAAQHNWDLYWGRGINGQGQVVGSGRKEGVSRAFLWDSASSPAVSELPMLPGSSSCTAIDISDTGKVAGSCTVGGVGRGVLWQKDEFGVWLVRDLGDQGTLGGNTHIGWAVNNAGDVCGRAKDPSGLDRPQVTFDGGPMVNLFGLSGSTNNYALGINDAAEVVGGSTLKTGDRAFLWRDLNGNRQNDPGELVDLNNKKTGGSVTLTLARMLDINNASQAVGWAVVKGISRACLLTPYP